jgi:ribosomal protein S18 acetylase RimI-like enzyme
MMLIISTFFLQLYAIMTQAMDGEQCVGVIICKLDKHREALRGYIAMLAVAKEYRKRKIGTTLVQMSIAAMKEQNADEVRKNFIENGLNLDLGCTRDV